jgi:hypothetical protein|tara:strand:- start:1815 stop:2018 length:204 start_codon:yes stop_codon:yes gene_type:complete
MKTGNFLSSFLKKRAQCKLALAINILVCLITSTGYLFDSQGVIFLFYIFSFALIYNIIIQFFLFKND